MAIKLSKKIMGGQVLVEYHRVGEIPKIQNHSDDQKVSVECLEYTNKAAKDAGLVPLSSGHYIITINKSEIVGSSSDILAVIYSKLMALDEFQGAIEE